MNETGDETAATPEVETKNEAPAPETASGTATTTITTESEAGDPIFEALWSRALENWEDVKIHQSLLQHALTVQNLPELAGRYRKLSDDEAKAPLAKKRLDALIVAATQMMYATKSPERQGVPRSINVSAAGICFVVILFAIYAFLHR